MSRRIHRNSKPKLIECRNQAIAIAKKKFYELRSTEKALRGKFTRICLEIFTICNRAFVSGCVFDTVQSEEGQMIKVEGCPSRLVYNGETLSVYRGLEIEPVKNCSRTTRDLGRSFSPLD